MPQPQDITTTKAQMKDNPDEAIENILKDISADDTNAFLDAYDDVPAQFEAQNDKAGPLSGVPIAVKDNILVKGKHASAASNILKNYVAPYSATAIQRLEESGAVLVGRTNMDEFAMGSSTEHSAFQITKNPHDLSRVPGGSSGGSAAAVASGLVPAALGSDTGGSVRQPASFCGVVGFKPTYGAISRYGLMAMGSSLDQIGPITNTVADAKDLFDVMRGEDKKDATTIQENTYGVPTGAAKTIGVPQNLVAHDGVSQAVRDNFRESLQVLEDAGYEIRDIEIPGLEHALEIYYIIMPAEVSSNLARFDGVKYGHRAESDDLLKQYIQTRKDGFGEEVKRRILLGTYVLSAGYYDAYYRTAVRARRAIQAGFQKAFGEVDVIATPTTPTPAFEIGANTSDPLAMYAQDMFTVGANIAGIPALSVPSGSVAVDGNNLPLGLHLQAARGDDDRLLAVGEKFEKMRNNT